MEHGEGGKCDETLVLSKVGNSSKNSTCSSVMLRALPSSGQLEELELCVLASEWLHELIPSEEAARYEAKNRTNESNERVRKS